MPRTRLPKRFHSQSPIINIVTNDETVQPDIPIFSFHWSFWHEGKRHQSAPISGFVSAAAAVETANQLMNVAREWRRRIVEE